MAAKLYRFMSEAQSRLLACYEAIGDASRRMVEAARAADWGAFAERERACEALIERIERIGDPRVILDARGRRRRFEILRGVLIDDAQIRELIEPWMADVEVSMGRVAPRRVG
jgi:flagellar protein FliT